MGSPLGSTARAGWLLWAALGASAANAAAPLPDVDAIVRYETRQVTAAGVTRVESWQERLVRRGDQVWAERVLPQGKLHEHESVAEQAGHKHFDADTSARWLTLKADGSVDLRFVDRAHKAVVSVPRAEFGTVGFDGRFDAAASLVPPAVALGMKPGAVAGEAQWRTDRRDGWSHRVLWSATRQLAMRIESSRHDGSVRRIVTVQLQPAAAASQLPWRHLADYTPKNYDDFMD